MSFCDHRSKSTLLKIAQLCSWTKHFSYPLVVTIFLFKVYFAPKSHIAIGDVETKEKEQ